MLSPNGLGVSGRLTQTTYQEAVAETVRGLKREASERDMADAWGVSSGTVGNALNKQLIYRTPIGHNISLKA